MADSPSLEKARVNAEPKQGNGAPDSLSVVTFAASAPAPAQNNHHAHDRQQAHETRERQFAVQMDQGDDVAMLQNSRRIGIGGTMPSLSASTGVSPSNGNTIFALEMQTGKKKYREARDAFFEMTRIKLGIPEIQATALQETVESLMKDLSKQSGSGLESSRDVMAKISQKIHRELNGASNSASLVQNQGEVIKNVRELGEVNGMTPASSVELAQQVNRRIEIEEEVKSLAKDLGAAADRSLSAADVIKLFEGRDAASAIATIERETGKPFSAFVQSKLKHPADAAVITEFATTAAVKPATWNTYFTERGTALEAERGVLLASSKADLENPASKSRLAALTKDLESNRREFEQRFGDSPDVMKQYDEVMLRAQDRSRAAQVAKQIAVDTRHQAMYDGLSYGNQLKSAITQYMNEQNAPGANGTQGFLDRNPAFVEELKNVERNAREGGEARRKAAQENLTKISTELDKNGMFSSPDVTKVREDLRSISGETMRLMDDLYHETAQKPGYAHLRDRLSGQWGANSEIVKLWDGWSARPASKPADTVDTDRVNSLFQQIAPSREVEARLNGDAVTQQAVGLKQALQSGDPVLSVDSFLHNKDRAAVSAAFEKLYGEGPLGVAGKAGSVNAEQWGVLQKVLTNGPLSREERLNYIEFRAADNRTLRTVRDNSALRNGAELSRLDTDYELLRGEHAKLTDRNRTAQFEQVIAERTQEVQSLYGGLKQDPANANLLTRRDQLEFAATNEEIRVAVAGKRFDAAQQALVDYRATPRVQELGEASEQASQMLTAMQQQSERGTSNDPRVKAMGEELERLREQIRVQAKTAEGNDRSAAGHLKDWESAHGVGLTNFWRMTSGQRDAVMQLAQGDAKLSNQQSSQLAVLRRDLEAQTLRYQAVLAAEEESKRLERLGQHDQAQHAHSQAHSLFTEFAEKSGSQMVVVTKEYNEMNSKGLEALDKSVVYLNRSEGVLRTTRTGALVVGACASGQWWYLGTLTGIAVGTNAVEESGNMAINNKKLGDAARDLALNSADDIKNIAITRASIVLGKGVSALTTKVASSTASAVLGAERVAAISSTATRLTTIASGGSRIGGAVVGGSVASMGAEGANQVWGAVVSGQEMSVSDRVHRFQKAGVIGAAGGLLGGGAEILRNGTSSVVGKMVITTGETVGVGAVGYYGADGDGTDRGISMVQAILSAKVGRDFASNGKNVTDSPENTTAVANENVPASSKPNTASQSAPVADAPEFNGRDVSEFIRQQVKADVAAMESAANSPNGQSNGSGGTSASAPSAVVEPKLTAMADAPDAQAQRYLAGSKQVALEMNAAAAEAPMAAEPIHSAPRSKVLTGTTLRGKLMIWALTVSSMVGAGGSAGDDYHSVAPAPEGPVARLVQQGGGAAPVETVHRVVTESVSQRTPAPNQSAPAGETRQVTASVAQEGGSGGRVATQTLQQTHTQTVVTSQASPSATLTQTQQQQTVNAARFDTISLQQHRVSYEMRIMQEQVQQQQQRQEEQRQMAQRDEQNRNERRRDRHRRDDGGNGLDPLKLEQMEIAQAEAHKFEEHEKQELEAIRLRQDHKVASAAHHMRRVRLKGNQEIDGMEVALEADDLIGINDAAYEKDEIL